MSEILIENDSFPASISVPADGDARTAASIVTPLQALTNRTRHLFSKLGAFINGGTISPAAGVSIVLDGNNLNLVGGQLVLAGSTLQAGGGLRSYLMTAGQTGCANRKVRLITSGSGDVEVNTEHHDTVIVSGISGTMTLELTPPAGSGAHMRIVNESTTQFVAFKPQGGATFGTNLKFSAGQFWMADLVWDGSAWRLSGVSPYSP